MGMPIVKNWTTCKDCNVILYNKDADKDGLCEDCRVEPKAKGKEPKGPKED